MQVALRHFLTMLPVIECKYEHDFDVAPSHEVLRDSLGNFKPMLALQGGETCKVRAYFEHVWSLTTLYVF